MMRDGTGRFFLVFIPANGKVPILVSIGGKKM
jgi:hypothetical protein